MSPSQESRFQKLFLTHRDAVWSYCHRRLQRDDVQDAVADVFLVAWRRLEDIPGDDEALLWLYGVARNVVRNAARSTQRRRRLHLKAASLSHADVPAPERLVVRRFEDRDLIEKVARLKPLDQELPAHRGSARSNRPTGLPNPAPRSLDTAPDA